MTVADADGRELKTGTPVVAADPGALRSILAQLAGERDWDGYLARQTRDESEQSAPRAREAIEAAIARDFATRPQFVVRGASPESVLVSHPDAEGALAARGAPPRRLAEVRPDRLRSAAPRTVLDRLGQRYLGLPAYAWAIGLVVGAAATVIVVRDKSWQERP